MYIVPWSILSHKDGAKCARVQGFVWIIVCQRFSTILGWQRKIVWLGRIQCSFDLVQNGSFQVRNPRGKSEMSHFSWASDYRLWNYELVQNSQAWTASHVICFLHWPGYSDKENDRLWYSFWLAMEGNSPAG